MGFAETYEEFVNHLREVATLSSCESVLGWDEQTYLPKGGVEHRANQLGLLSGMIHDKSTDPRLGELLEELAGSDELDADSPRAANVREARRDFDRATKLPKRLVEEMSKATSLGQQAWIEAKPKNDFASFQPWLEKIVALKREEAEAVGYDDVPYDALLDTYETGASTQTVEATFAALRDELVPLAKAIADSPNQPDASILEREYPVDVQRTLGLEAAEAIGFDFDRGRLDVAAHPFCSGIGPGDCRLTTRYDERFVPMAFFGTLHEAGHGIYEQGLDTEAYGTPAGHSCSLGVHESQSRMWENLVGRSRAFWDYFYGRFQAGFPAALSDVPLDTFHAAVNTVRPSFIRVEADEVTYNLHIMLRFELEQPLISGDLAPADVPAAWNEKFEAYFGLVPEDHAHGCLQDIHWSAGLIGYFPTYALGNLYGAQLFDAAEAALGDLDAAFAAGTFRPLKEWLNENVHRHGRRFQPTDLVERVSGKPLSHEPLMRRLHAKFDHLYGL